MSLIKKFSSSALALGILFAAVPSSFAAESTTSNQVTKISSLSKAQQKEYNNLVKQGYNVTVADDGAGKISLNAYKSNNSTLANQSLKAKVLQTSKGGFSTQAVEGSQTFSVSQSIYNGYTYMGKISGKISVRYVGKTVYIKSDTLTTSPAQSDGGPFTSYQSGNPAKLTAKFKFNQKVGYSVRQVPFTVYFRITSGGKVTFSNPVSLK